MALNPEKRSIRDVVKVTSNLLNKENLLKASSSIKKI